MIRDTPADTDPSVWAFDLGKASLGEAVRVGDELRHAESWLIPEDFAQRGPATKAGTPANRYRAMKTREAHLAREARLREICTEAGIEILSPRDSRLTRQFPAKSDNSGTCYTSCLLRIQLLRGVKLEGWQVFKALHSAIQRRGYDKNPAWTNKRSSKTADAKEETETNERLSYYQRSLEQMAAGNTDYVYPCFLDAWRIGLWTPGKPDHYELRIDHLASPARNRQHSDNIPIVAPRELVEAEVRALLVVAAKYFPKLAGHADKIIFGPGAERYASYNPLLRKEHGLREGGANDWLGILGQKVPRFDNRIIAKCALIPRLNVCKNERRTNKDGGFYPDSLLPAEVTFLLKLKNIRIQCIIDKQVIGLSAQQIRTIFENPTRKSDKFSFTSKEWDKLCVKLGARPVPGHDEIKAPRDGGRSRFCRPALKILKTLILSGEAPSSAHTREFAELEGNTDINKGLVEADLDFMKQMGATWDGLYIPDQQYDALLRTREKQGRDVAIRSMLGSVNDPIVRHRLETLWKRLQKLELTYGTPSEVVLEFVRDDFLGAQAKRDLQKFQNEREKARTEAREQTKQLGATGRAASLKYELLKQQGFSCLYTGNPIAASELDECEIEHIVPRAQGGPDAVVNYVVTSVATNKKKDNRTPYEWFSANGFTGWDAYLKRVNSCATQLRGKKVKLLTSPNAQELVRRYTALAETAWIARLSQTLVALYFGWPIGSEGGNRRITIISGGLTARVRRQYRLNSLLHPNVPPAGTDALEWEEICDKKNRDDDRHHALDAMVLSFIPGWTRDPEKTGFFRLPDGITRETFGKKIAKVIPRNLVFSKPPLEATIYGQRTIDNHRFGVARIKLNLIAVKVTQNGKRSIKPNELIDTSTIVDPVTRSQLDQFLSQHQNLTLEQWDRWCTEVRRGTANGPKINKVLRTITKPDVLDEYADLSKEKFGQLRKGSQHQGYFIVQRSAPTKKLPDKRILAVCPVYAHESIHRRNLSLKQEQGAKVLGFFTSGCLVQIDSAIEHPRTPLKPGVYRLNSIWEQGNIVVTDTSSQTSAPIGLVKFISAGFRRVD